MSEQRLIDYLNAAQAKIDECKRPHNTQDARALLLDSIEHLRGALHRISIIEDNERSAQAINARNIPEWAKLNDWQFVEWFNTLFLSDCQTLEQVEERGGELDIAQGLVCASKRITGAALAAARQEYALIRAFRKEVRRRIIDKIVD